MSRNSILSAKTVESQFASCEPPPSALVLLLCTGLHDSLNLMPDYELERCKVICGDVMSRAESAETCFALGRLLTYEGNYESALRLVTEAKAKAPGDELYCTWELLLQVLAIRCTPKPKLTIDFQSIWLSVVNTCSSKNSRTHKESLTPPSTAKLPQLSIEQLWCYLELALADPQSQGDPRRYAAQLKEMHRYYGYLAWGLCYLQSSVDWNKGVEILQELIRTHPLNPESYLKLWGVYYYRLKDYESAMDVIEQAFVKATEQRLFRLLVSLKYAKTLWRVKRTEACLDFLQTQYSEQQGHMGYLYLYGRLSVQSESLRERVFAINALQETIRLGAKRRRGLAFYWLAKAYLLGRETAQAVSAFQQAALLLPISQAKKLTQTHSYLNQMTSFILSLDQLRNFPIVGDSGTAIQAQHLAAAVSMCDGNAGNLAYSQVLFGMGLQSSALAVAQTVCECRTDSLLATIQRLRILKRQGNWERMKLEAEACIEVGLSCTVREGVDLVMLYADSLALGGEASKGILALKCAGKSFPPVAFSDFPYLYTLQRATSLAQLALLPRQINPQSDLSIPPCFPDFPSLLAKVSHATKHDLQHYEPRPTTSTLESPSSFQRSFQAPLGLTLDQETPAIGRFSLCSSVRFLYKIGKLAVRYKCGYEDACWALKDCLGWLKRRLPSPFADPSSLQAKVRALLWALLKEVRQGQSFEPI